MSRERTEREFPHRDTARSGHYMGTPGSGLVRPYAVTGGQTSPRYQLQLEAMVTVSHYEARDLSVLSPECQAILGFCREWRSVAEISAVLRMPLGVARVLVADMAVEGLVKVHQLDGRPDLGLLERVLAGLRRLPPSAREVLLRAGREIEDALILDIDAGLADVKSRALRAGPGSPGQHASGHRD